MLSSTRWSHRTRRRALFPFLLPSLLVLHRWSRRTCVGEIARFVAVCPRFFVLSLPLAAPPVLARGCPADLARLGAGSHSHLQPAI